jgi:hypothetical protein
MGRPLKIQKLGAGSIGSTTGVDLGFPNVSELENPVTPAGIDSDEFYGVVGGNIDSAGDAGAGANANYPVVLVRVFIEGQSEENGFIVRQKGSRQYLVQGASSGEVGVCTLSDEADASLTSGNMTISVYPGDSSLVRLKKLTNKWCLDWSDNRYFVNFFAGDQGQTAIKAGAYLNATTELALIEQSP